MRSFGVGSPTGSSSGKPAGRDMLFSVLICDIHFICVNKIDNNIIFDKNEYVT